MSYFGRLRNCIQTTLSNRTFHRRGVDGQSEFGQPTTDTLTVNSRCQFSPYQARGGSHGQVMLSANWIRIIWYTLYLEITKGLKLKKNICQILISFICIIVILASECWLCSFIWCGFHYYSFKERNLAICCVQGSFVFSLGLYKIQSVTSF